MARNNLSNFISDLRVQITDEFDYNFVRKGFFNEKWAYTKIPNRRGSLMMRSGALRNSIRSTSAGNSIHFSSSLPYASIHNEGGTITVTAKMKKYFWAMYMKAAGGRKSIRLSQEADFFKAMALKKVGSKIKIAKRQFIGPHADIDKAVDFVFKQHLSSFVVNCFQIVSLTD